MSKRGSLFFCKNIILILSSIIFFQESLTAQTVEFKKKENANIVGGYENLIEGSHNSTFGSYNLVKGNNSSAFGTRNQVWKNTSSAVGYLNSLGGIDNFIVGYNNKTNGEKNLVFGNSYTVSGGYSGVFGIAKKIGQIHGKNSYTIGNDNQIAMGADDNFIFGNDVWIQGGITHSVVLGSGSTVKSSHEVSVGSIGKERKITNVKEGEISSYSTEVIIGKQLYEVEKATATNIDFKEWKKKLGLETTTDQLNKNLEKIKKNEKEIEENKTSIQQNKVELINNREKIEKYENRIHENEENIKENSSKIMKNNKKIEEHENGIHKNQEEILENTVNIVENKIEIEELKKKNIVEREKLRKEIQENNYKLRNEISHVGSLSAALAALHPAQYEEGAPNQIMSGIGHYKNKQAIAIGATHYFNENIMITTGIAVGSENRIKTMANLGITWKIGSTKNLKNVPEPSSLKEIQNEMRRLALKNQEQEKLILMQQQQIKQLEEMIYRKLLDKS